MGISSPVVEEETKSNKQNISTWKTNKTWRDEEAKGAWHLTKQGEDQVEHAAAGGGLGVGCRRRLLKKKKKSCHVEGRWRRDWTMERRVTTLKKLIPNGESMEADGLLFSETADYILALQMRVKVMQIMVDLLSSDS